MSEALPLLGGLTAEQFLNEYWQKKPLLIRNAFPDFEPPLSADELAGLACEAEIESRILIEEGHSTLNISNWTVEHGPFDEARFATLPETHWTLLVQGVNTWVPEVAQLIEPFRFIPDWRIDDIMISYAPEHGSVGAHLDHYDVFLIQAHGHRHWQINTQIYTEEDCVPDLPIRILKNFTAEQEWTLGPGDMLYLPPNVAHYGVAQDDCMTYSVGFRAPAKSELLSSFIDDLVPTINETQRYQDNDLPLQENSGEISIHALNKIQNIIRLAELPDQQINRWYGRYITEVKNPQENNSVQDLTLSDIEKTLKNNEFAYKDPHSRYAYINSDDECFLYVNGDEFLCDCGLAKYLCKHNQYPAQQLTRFLSDNDSSKLLTFLFNHQRLILNL